MEEESTFCIYCRGKLLDKKETMVGFHVKCKVEIENFSSSRFGNYSGDIEVIQRLENKLQIQIFIISGDNANSDIPYYIKVQNHEIVGLTLKGLDLEDIPEEIFLLKDLKYLNLENSELNEFPEGIQYLKNLEELNLSNCQIENYSRDSFLGQSLKRVNYSNNEISGAPVNFFRMVHLEFLDLSNNYDFLEDVFFEQLPNIDLLDITNNHLIINNVDILRKFRIVKLFPEIEINTNGISNLPGLEINYFGYTLSLQEVFAFEELILSINQNIIDPEKYRAQFLPDYVNKRKLSLYNCQLYENLNFISNLVKLEELDLSNNELRDLPDLKKLQNLKTLNLRKNYFKTFPKEILKLPNLVDLDISENLIWNFPKDIFKLKNLKTFYFEPYFKIEISNNNTISNDNIIEYSGSKMKLSEAIIIFEIVQEIYGLLWDFALEFDKLFITFVEEKRVDCNSNFNVFALNLADFNLRNIPQSISKLENLEVLNFSGNSLENFPDLSKFKKLKILDVSYSKIYKFPTTKNEFFNLEKFIFNPFFTLNSNSINHLHSDTLINIYNKYPVAYSECGNYVRVSIEIFFNLRNWGFFNFTDVNELLADQIKIENGYITCIKLFKKKIRDFPEGIFKLKHLKTLSLPNNHLWKISEIEKSILDFYYEKRDNNIPKKELVANYLKKLKILNFQNNYELKKIPLWVTKLRSLEVLNLSNTQIEKLPAGLFKLKNLRKILLEPLFTIIINKESEKRILCKLDSQLFIDLTEGLILLKLFSELFPHRSNNYDYNRIKKIMNHCNFKIRNYKITEITINGLEIDKFPRNLFNLIYLEKLTFKDLQLKKLAEGELVYFIKTSFTMKNIYLSGFFEAETIKDLENMGLVVDNLFDNPFGFKRLKNLKRVDMINTNVIIGTNEMIKEVVQENRKKIKQTTFQKFIF